MSSSVDKYKKMDPIEHIINRPDTYVGSTRPKQSEEYVVEIKNTENGLEHGIKKEKITYPPALLRIFVEAVSNAIDNVQRSKDANIPMSKIKISINQETGETSVWNDGIVIPIEKNEKENCYVHSMIFGQLLTSSNYNDSEERLISGRNGLGIKLTNIFSSHFKVKAVDPKQGKMLQQEWTNNMKTTKDPKITSSSLKNGYTEITWTPDFSLFHLDGYTADIIKLYTKFVYDTAMLTKINVYLNDTKLGVKTLSDYAKLYDSPTNEIVTLKSSNCEVVLTTANDFEAISFVNGVFTANGGVHVEAWSQAIFRPVAEALNKPNKPQISAKDVKQYFRLFVNATVVNPEFTSQSKTELASPQVETNVEKKTINSILKWSHVEQIKDLIESKELLVLKKSEAKKKGFTRIEGLDDANNAGKKNSKECTLILCEGLSAKSYAVKGIETGAFGKTGRDWFGIYPLRGKVLNVRKTNAASIGKNREITDIIQSLGLRYGTDYSRDENFDQLRYGKLLILTDADTDGKHIEGLIINFIHHLFPSLLSRPQPFLVDMMTPIARFVMKNKQEHIFYDENKADLFYKENENKVSKVKYYKGLGTSSDKEIKETFGKRIIYFHSDEETLPMLNKVFGSKAADERKEWLSNYDPNHTLDENLTEQSISMFIDKEMIKFSIDDCKRSIPNIIDGFKESQRKILYACLLKNFTDTVKVAQLAGYIAEKTNYHHGEQNLTDTICHMATDFVGSNNIPIFVKDGQFGSRLSGGKDAASGRYIFTKLHSFVRLIFRPEDDGLLERIIDDGDIVEPKYYVPIIPMILANGCTTGIGTGWSCNIPKFNPLDLITCVESWIENSECTVDILPFYRGFTGKIEKVADGKYVSYGEVTEHGRDTVVVRELPVGYWTNDFKEKLDVLKEEKQIKGYKNYSGVKHPLFVIQENPDSIKCSINTLKLSTNLNTTNMVLFDQNNKIKKYDHIKQIIDEFCQVRLNLYIERKKAIIKQLEKERLLLKNKIRFIEEIMDEKLVLKRKKKDIIVAEMKTKKYDLVDETYDYLLRMQIIGFTEEKIQELMDEMRKLEKKLEAVKTTTEKEMWQQDLNELKVDYEKWLAEMTKLDDSEKIKKF